MKSVLTPFCFLFCMTLALFSRAQERQNVELLRSRNEVDLSSLNVLLVKDTIASYEGDDQNRYYIDLSNADSLFWNSARIISLIRQHAELPKYIISNGLVKRGLLDSLNQVPVNKVQVLVNGEPLHNVGWKELPEVITSGIFESYSVELSPQKRGYWFSPDIFNFNAYNSDLPKVFMAYKYDLKEKLRLYMPLKNDLQSVVSTGNVQASRDMHFVKDDERGRVARFNGESSYIDFNAQNDDEYTEITVSAWVKPEQVEGTHSIIGKGHVFSAKIMDKHLLFTIPGIRDHLAGKIEVKPGDWVHISYVYVPGNKVYFYVNGKLEDQVNASNIAPTDHSILIGTNLWGQNYKGSMSNLAVWTRALSNEEVEQVYRNGIPLKRENDMELQSYLIAVILILLIFISFILFRVRKNRKIKMPLKPVETNKLSSALYRITVLGGFKLYNYKDQDITHRFSPKRKELFLLLLLFTIKDKGISSGKMAEILWPSLNAAGAKNNRSTQIKEIRNTLKDQLNVEISYTDKKWMLLLDKDVSSDIMCLSDLIPNLFSSKKSEISTGDLPQIITLVNNGVFLPNLEFEWLDEFKSKYSNTVLDILSPWLEEDKMALLGAHLLIELVNAILMVDALHEEAIKIKIDLLIRDGKHMSAKKTAENFQKLYEAYYKEAYEAELI